jgi:hypothetical protein
MVNGPTVSYQPAVAYQGGQVNTPEQEPRSGRTQPRQAPAADTQRGEQRSSSSREDRGQLLDVTA